MTWSVYFFQNSRGEEIVKDFLKSQGQLLMAKTKVKIKLLEVYGPFLGMPHARKLIGAIYELRIRGKEEFRIFYAFIDNKICLLHAFKKQTQETPNKEIKTAQERLKSLTQP